MGRKKRDTVEFRFYEIPQGQSCLALLGDKWIMVYGKDDKFLHFHNLFEVGYCRNGSGDLILDEKVCKYESEMLSVIPANYPHSTYSSQPNFWEYIFFDVEDDLGAAGVAKALIGRQRVVTIWTIHFFLRYRGKQLLN